MIGRIGTIGKGGVGVIFTEKGVVLLEDVIDGEIVEYEIIGKRKSVLRGSVKKLLRNPLLEKSPGVLFMSLAEDVIFNI